MTTTRSKTQAKTRLATARFLVSTGWMVLSQHPILKNKATNFSKVPLERHARQPTSREGRFK